MKQCVLLLTLAIQLVGLGARAQTCFGLFTEPLTSLTLKTETHRLQITQKNADETPSKLFISQDEFSANVDQAVLEMIRMVLRNSDFKLEDKNVLIKNKFTLGIPIKDGYSLQLTYESKSDTMPRFVLQDKIILITPTGKEFKITEDLVDSNQVKLNKSEFDLQAYFPAGLELKLKVPLVVEGQLLTAFANLAKYFEYFEKEQIRQILKSDNLFLIKTRLQLGRAKKVFFDVLIKEPFKILISGGIIFMLYNSSVMVAEPNKKIAHQTPPAISQMHIANTINSFQLPANDVALRYDFEQIRQQALSVAKTKTYSPVDLADLKMGPNNSMIKTDSVFVFDKVSSVSGLKHTYIVFAEEVTFQQGPGLQYFVLEVNAERYQRLIAFIKNREHLIAPELIAKKAEITK